MFQTVDLPKMSCPIKEKATRSIQCYGFNVHCYSLLGSPECFLCATSGRCRANRLLSRKSGWNVLGLTICMCNGNNAVPFQTLYPCPTWEKCLAAENNNPISSSRCWLNSHMFWFKQLFTLSSCTRWSDSNGPSRNSCGISSSCTSLCYTSHFMGWWQWQWHQIITLLPFSPLHSSHCGISFRDLSSQNL